MEGNGCLERGRIPRAQRRRTRRGAFSVRSDGASGVARAAKPSRHSGAVSAIKVTRKDRKTDTPNPSPPNTPPHASLAHLPIPSRTNTRPLRHPTRRAEKEALRKRPREKKLRCRRERFLAASSRALTPFCSTPPCRRRCGACRHVIVPETISLGQTTADVMGAWFSTLLRYRVEEGEVEGCGVWVAVKDGRCGRAATSWALPIRSMPLTRRCRRVRRRSNEGGSRTGPWQRCDTLTRPLPPPRSHSSPNTPVQAHLLSLLGCGVGG
jgi:hypothetical protein